MKIYSLIGALALSTLAYAQQHPAVVEGKFTGYGSEDKIYVNYRNGEDRVSDSVALTPDGKFQLTADVTTPVLATLAAGKSSRQAHSNGVLSLYLEPGTTRIKTTDSLSEETMVRGGRANKDLAKFNKQLEKISHLAEAASERYKGATDEELNSPEFMQELAAMREQYDQKRTAVVKDFIDEHPKSFVSFDHFRDILGYTPEADEMEALFNTLDPVIRESDRGRDYAAQIEKARATSVGQLAPEFTQMDPDGNPISLSDFKGQYVLIDFWASWCGPCRRENPNVVKAYHALKDQGFTVLGVSLDRPGQKESWLKAVETDQLDWPQVSDLKFWDNAAAKLYSVRSIPQNFLIDPEGKIVAKNLRGEDLATKIAAYIQ